MAGWMLIACSERKGGHSQVLRNPNRVPHVIGSPVRRAASTLRAADYACGIVEIWRKESLRGGFILEQDPDAGSRAFVANIIQLVVTAPYSLEEMPPNCVDRTEGS